MSLDKILTKLLWTVDVHVVSKWTDIFKEENGQTILGLTLQSVIGLNYLGFTTMIHELIVFVYKTIKYHRRY